MIVSYENESLRELCEDEERAISTFGYKVAELFFSRLSDIEAADNPYDLIVGNPHEININGLNCYKIDITADTGIIFTPALSTSYESWEDVRRVKIIEIMNHEF